MPPFDTLPHYLPDVTSSLIDPDQMFHHPLSRTSPMTPVNIAVHGYRHDELLAEPFEMLLR